MARTAAILRTEPLPEPPARRESAARPVSVIVSTVVVRSGTASRLHGGVAHAHGQREHRDDHVTGERARLHVGCRGHDRGAEEQSDLDHERASDMLGVTIGSHHRQNAADGRSGEKGTERHERCHDG